MSIFLKSCCEVGTVDEGNSQSKVTLVISLHYPRHPRNFQSWFSSKLAFSSGMILFVCLTCIVTVHRYNYMINWAVASVGGRAEGIKEGGGHEYCQIGHQAGKY